MKEWREYRRYNTQKKTGAKTFPSSVKNIYLRFRKPNKSQADQMKENLYNYTQRSWKEKANYLHGFNH